MRPVRRWKPTLRCFAALAVLALPLDGLHPLALRGSVQQPPGALPAGSNLSIMMSEEWLPEPFQRNFFQAPAYGTPARGCASVIRVNIEPAGGALAEPLTITFDCGNNGVPYAYVNHRWSRVPFTRDEEGRTVLSAPHLTTYAFLHLDFI